MARRRKSIEGEDDAYSVLDHLEGLQSLVDRVIQAGLDPSIFDEDLDVRYADNVIEFAVSPEYMGMESLWAKQAEQAVKLFCDYCPEDSDMEFLNDPPVDASIGTFKSKVVLLVNGKCPECEKTRDKLFDKLPYELVSCLGQRSGKTALLGGVLLPYYLHRFLAIRNPARFYGLMPNSFFEMTVVAVTVGQIKKTLWPALKGAIALSPWFQDYIKKLKSLEKEKGLEKGDLVKVMDSYIWFGNKKIGISYAAADMKSLRGSTRITAAIDELGWFNSGKDVVRANADETYAALSNSLRTVRSASDVKWKQGEYNTLPGMMFNISSPSSQYDKMMSLLKEGARDKRKVTFHMSSWEASPLITRESLETDEANNPVKFWRDFGAVPPLADSPFIESARAIYDMNTAERPLLSWKPTFIKDKLDPKRVRYIAAQLMGGLNDSRTRIIPRVITVDCGETQNSFAIGVYHLEPSTDDTGNTFVVVNDAIISAIPEKIIETGEIIPVHFPTMFNIVKRLCDKGKGLNVKCVLYDRWQSTGHIQELREMKVKALRYSPKEQDFKFLRSLVYSSRFKTPRWEHTELTDLDVTNIEMLRSSPYTTLAVQFATVREIGKKIIKPEAGDDDLFRTSVLASYYMSEHTKDFLTFAARSSLSGRESSVGSVSFLGSSRNYSISKSRSSIGSIKGRTHR